ncbi:MAG: ABC transporter ATP-binding protein [Simkaniaceae bacterium]|nr:ABC transporter ATP-binding protein [Simkaniaceae bacterium]MCF7851743.1 ABC transporter ATP-binding protein [Simkaniaceae bacterium]
MIHPPLKVDHLIKKYGPNTAVQDISFELREGEIFGLLGPNGAGKTTTISCITTLEEPSSGHIEIFGKDNIKEARAAKFLLGCVPQELIHHGYFTVKEIMHFHASYYGLVHVDARIDDLLKKIDLYHHRGKLISQLSGGMKRRLLIAKALIHNPKLLLLDEPTAGVDVELRHNLWDLIFQLKEEGVSILLTTHYLEEAEKLCDRLGIIRNGKLIKVTPKLELIHTMGIRTITLFLTKPIHSIHHPHLYRQTEKELVFKAPQAFSVSNLLEDIQLSHHAFSDISVEEGKLEDIFTQILNHE